ncbi:MAG TPA: hypothetical protein VGR06_08170 [Actinophytocola sp.]|nr:hypothetical protein [Actinophytocola sp.]
MRLDTWDTTAAVAFDQQLWNELITPRRVGLRHRANTAARRAGQHVVDGGNDHVTPDRHIVLRPGTPHITNDPGVRRVGDVDDPEAVVVTGDGEVAPERQIGLEVPAQRRVIPTEVAGPGDVRKRVRLRAVLILVVRRVRGRRPDTGH